MANLNIPYTFTNGTTANATEVNAVVSAIKTFVDTQLVQKDGSIKAPAIALDSGSVTSDKIENLTIVDGDINTAANIAQSKIANLTSDLALKAPLVSPSLTGIPTAPTAAIGTNTIQVATTGFVISQAASANPAALGAIAVGTATRYARADHVHPTTGLGLTSGNLGQFAATTSAQLAGVVSDETGTGSLVFATSPTLTTPVIGVATGTSFNGITGPSLTTPIVNGVAAVGVGTTSARADHVHPTDTSRAATISPTFTGTPLSTTAAVDTNTTQIATTAYVVGQGYAKLVSPTFSGTVNGITKSMVGLGSVDNTSDTAKPVSTAQQTALNLKANLLSPTFSGTVSGITKAMVGLGNVDNTADTAKPVSTAQQTALNLKANLLSPTFSGTVVLPAQTVTPTMLADSIPRGVVSYTPIITSTNANGTDADMITANTFTAVAGRKYRVTYFEPQVYGTVNASATAKIKIGGTQVQQSNAFYSTLGYSATTTTVHVGTFTAGPVTTLTCTLAVTAGTATVSRSSTQYAYLMVEDIGVF